MEKIIKLSTTILLFIACIVHVYSQEQIQATELTDYQNKRRTLVSKTFEDILSTMNETEQASFLYTMALWSQKNEEEYKIGQSDPIGELELLEGFLAQTCNMAPWIIGSEATTLHQDIVLSKYTNICQNYRKARQTLDNNTPKSDLEKEQRIQTVRAQMRASTFQLEKRLQQMLAKWMEKGQLEKSTDYQTRLMTKSKFAFDSICSTLLSGDYVFDGLYYELGNYDADIEEYTIEFYYKDKRGNKIHCAKGHFALPPSEVINVNDILHSAFSAKDGIELQRIDGYIYPKYITWLKDDDSHNHLDITISVDAQNAEEVYFEFDRLGIQNSYLSGYSLPASTIPFYQSQKQIMSYLDSCNIEVVRLLDLNDASQIANGFFQKIIYEYKPYNIKSKFNYQSNYDLVKEKAKKILDKLKYDIELANYLNYHISEEQIGKITQTTEYRYLLQYLSETLPNEIVNLSLKSQSAYSVNESNVGNLFGELFHVPVKQNTVGLQFSDKYVLWKKVHQSTYPEIQKLYKVECHHYITLDTKANKEFNKNRQYFNSATDFIDAYLFSADYPDYKSAIKGKSYKEELQKRKSVH